jgi:hypothetical protein
MNIVQLLIIFLYILFFGIMFYIIHNRDCKLAIYFIWILIVISIIKLSILFKYNDLCEFANKMYCPIKK